MVILVIMLSIIMIVHRKTKMPHKFLHYMNPIINHNDLDRKLILFDILLLNNLKIIDKKSK